MNARFLFLPVGIAVMWLSLSTTPTEAVERTIVYIECTRDGEPISRGTGVVVSQQGHVLTAKHVVVPHPPASPDGIECKGSTGVAEPTKRLVIQQPTNLSVDAALLRFSDTLPQYEYVRFCSLENWMIRHKIFVAGFPGGTKTGVPSFREGVLSTVFPASNGLIETDGQTIAGMSGGPVYSHNLAGIVGIVIGAEFAADGTVSYYGILPVSDFADALHLVKSEAPCYRQKREADLTIFRWKTGDAPAKLGVRAEDGACFLSGIRGQFNDARDSLAVELQDGEYVLNGIDGAGGQVEATARCIWYD